MAARFLQPRSATKAARSYANELFEDATLSSPPQQQQPQHQQGFHHSHQHAQQPPQQSQQQDQQQQQATPPLPSARIPTQLPAAPLGRTPPSSATTEADAEPAVGIAADGAPVSERRVSDDSFYSANGSALIGTSNGSFVAPSRFSSAPNRAESKDQARSAADQLESSVAVIQSDDRVSSCGADVPSGSWTRLPADTGGASAADAIAHVRIARQPRELSARAASSAESQAHQQQPFQGWQDGHHRSISGASAASGSASLASPSAAAGATASDSRNTMASAGGPAVSRGTSAGPSAASGDTQRTSGVAGGGRRGSGEDLMLVADAIAIGEAHLAQLQASLSEVAPVAGVHPDVLAHLPLDLVEHHSMRRHAVVRCASTQQRPIVFNVIVALYTVAAGALP